MDELLKMLVYLAEAIRILQSTKPQEFHPA